MFELDFKEQDINRTSNIRETSEPNHSLPNVTVSSTGGEILPIISMEPNSELLFYSRKKSQQKGRDLSIIVEQNQSKTPSNDLLNQIGTENSVLQDLPYISPILSLIPESNEPSMKPRDFNVPIALRKGIRPCTKHPISKYLSYDKLSYNHSAFT